MHRASDVYLLRRIVQQSHRDEPVLFAYLRDRRGNGAPPMMLQLLGTLFITVMALMRSRGVR
jgi:hypothetical protein